MTTTPGPDEHTPSPADDALGGPLDEAAEADVAEQQQGLDGSGTVTEPSVPAGEADVADALEQGAEVGEEDDETYPRADG